MYKVLIKDGSLTSVVNETEVPLDLIKSFSILGRENQYVKFEMNDGEIFYLTKEEVKIEYI